MARNEYPAYEGLQVVPNNETKYNTQMEGLQVVPTDGLEYKAQTADIHPYVDDIRNIPVSPPISVTGHICGLKKRTFGIIVAIVFILVIVGAVVGGVVGSRSNHATSSDDSPTDEPVISGSSTPGPSSTSSSSSTSLSSISSSSISTSTTTAQNAYPTTPLPLDCPAINGTTRTASSSTSSQPVTFDIFCNANFAPGLDSANRNASSLDDCMESCVDLIGLGGICKGVVWDSIMNLRLESRRNCFLKSSKEGFAYNKKVSMSVAALVES